MPVQRQDLDAEKTSTPREEILSPEAQFLQLIEAEEGESTPPVVQPETQPEPDTTNSDEPEETEEDLEAPDEEDSEDPEEEQDSEDPAETDEDEEEPTEALYRVVANGEEKHVTLDELTRGYSRESDYTRQKQELTAQQQEAASELQAVQAERARYDGMLGQLEEAVKQAVPAEPDWAKLRTENPAEFSAVYAEWQQQQANLGKIREEREKVQASQMADYTAQRDQYVRGEQDKLLNEFPDLGDPEKGPKMHQALMDTALAVGYTADDVAGIEDSRAIKVLHYASLYLALKKSKPQREKRTKVTKTVKPGARTRTPVNTDTQKAVKKLKRTGSVEDAASVFLTDLNAKR